jgi:putative transposase
MYDYRRMTPKEQARVIEHRRLHHLPLHSPAHWEMGFSNRFLITAACYEHSPVIGRNIERMTNCEQGVLQACKELTSDIFAWCILPNHYHVLVSSSRLKELCKALGQFHGESSFRWNREDKQVGRKVWHRCFDREIRSERHFGATLNYVHHNPVHHGYVDKWTAWIWSSAAEFLGQVGRARAAGIWRAYPILKYGKKWDV